MEKIVKKIKINTTLRLLTGLHIGGSKDNVEIGGIDSPVIKIATCNSDNKKDLQPYIPGSSLKGKMRCLLEQVKGCKLGEDQQVSSLFGSAANKPSRLIVRDAYLTKDSQQRLLRSDTDMPYTETKYENTIDRVTGTTINGGIRQIERIPANAEFAVEFIINVIKEDSGETNEEMAYKMLQDAIHLLENDYLGGSGSRGYGQVKFGELKRIDLSPENNWNANGNA